MKIRELIQPNELDRRGREIKRLPGVYDKKHVFIGAGSDLEVATVVLRDTAGRVVGRRSIYQKRVNEDLQQLDEATLKQLLASVLLGGAMTIASNFLPAPGGRHTEQPAAQSAPAEKPTVADQLKQLEDELVARVTARHTSAKVETVRDVVQAALRHAKPTFPTAADLLAIAGVESEFNAAAKSNMRHDPAIGVMQIRPRVNGLKPAQLSSVDNQVAFAAELLHKYYQKLGNAEDALHAYNVGLANFKREKGLNPRYAPKVKRELESYADL